MTSEEIQQIFFAECDESLGAAEAGLAKAANVVAIGALIAATGIVQFETVVELLTLKFGQRSQEILAANKRALRLGADYVLKLPA